MSDFITRREQYLAYIAGESDTYPDEPITREEMFLAEIAKRISSGSSEVPGGVGILKIEKTSTNGLVDTYTITYTDYTTSKYTITNGANGLTPYIKDGNWWIGETDTGVKAEGKDGQGVSGVWTGSGDAPEGYDIQIDISGEPTELLTITNITESTVDGGSNVVTFSNGSTLRVKNGSKGKDGNDYVLTEADKTEIAEMISGDTIPEYWENYLPDKISAIRALQDEGGKDCFSFVVLTDMHYPSNLGKNSPMLAKRIMNKCNIKYALCLGDTQTRGYHYTKEALLAENETIEKMLSPIRDRLLQTEGNHDGAYGAFDRNGDGTISNYDSEGNIKEPAERETYVYNLTPAELHSAIYRKVGLVGDVHFDESGSGYYIDDIANKVRYIVLNTQCNDYELQADGTPKYPKMWLMRFTQSQFDLVIEALNSIPSASWGVVVAGHCPLFQEIGDRTVMQGVLKAYKDKTAYSGKYDGTAEGGAQYTNKLPLATDTDGSIYNGIGYKDGVRLNSSSAESPLSDAFLTGFIPVKAGDVIRLNGKYILDTHTSASSMNNLFVFKDDATKKIAWAWGAVKDKTEYQGLVGIVRNDEGYITQFTINPNWTYIENWETADLLIRLTLLGTGADAVITVNEEIVELEHGYDYVSVDCDFTNAKGELVGYFAGHTHVDSVNTVYGFNIVTTRCDAKEENTTDLNNERVKDTITEQSFDVFTVNKATRTIYATKIGAGDNRTISY